MIRMAKILMVLSAALATGACAPMLGGAMAAGRYGRPMYGPPPPPAYVTQPSLNRWDQVMSLRPNWVIEVLDSEGRTHNGRFIRASVKVLLFSTSTGETELARQDVVRVDLLDAQATDGDAGKDVALGAATGALAMGGGMTLIPYLLTGKVIVPPARFFVVGGAMGAVGALQRQDLDRRPRTIYVAPMRD
jgi:hypothetical protein